MLDKLSSRVTEAEDRIGTAEGQLVDLNSRVVNHLGTRAFYRAPDNRGAHRADRALGPRPPADQRPRPVLIRLLKCQDRDKILRIAAQRSRENKGPIKYDGKPVLFFPDLSASLVKRRKEYDRVKTELRSKDIPFALLHPATLRITLPDGRRRFFQTPKEVAAFLRGTPAGT
ncbi:hypothetical protein F7725_003651 [Dissostichus mawsoni]|uniref:L1 transposable element RRM domain-containing protein n=1 Tax=Dissostichus mawsoni TaxID=36200 RepID=A0A7J5YBS7_DISMA|nr:hypothetical protein F7725_003651 [Dissostichus mawsoni]